jgi:hypothetical protein
MMKKCYLAIFALFFTVASYAQSGIGIKAGTNFSAVRGSAYTKLMTGAAVGVYAEFPLAKELYLQPNLFYEMKGGKAKHGGDMKVKLNYLTLPVDLVYKPKLGSGNLVLGAGPYLGYALSGKIKGDPHGGSFNGDRNPFKGNNDFRRWDAGGHLQVGYEFSNGLTVGVNGSVSAFSIRSEGTKYRNTAFGVTLGYALHR